MLIQIVKREELTLEKLFPDWIDNYINGLSQIGIIIDRVK